MPVITFPLTLTWKDDGPLISLPNPAAAPITLTPELPRGITADISLPIGWVENAGLDEPYVFAEGEEEFFVRSRRATISGLPNNLPTVVNSLNFRFMGTIDEVRDPTWSIAPWVRFTVTPPGSDTVGPYALFRFPLGRGFNSQGNGPYFGTWLRPEPNDPWPFDISDIMSTAGWTGDLDLVVSISTAMGFTTDAIQTTQMSVVTSDFQLEMVLDYEGPDLVDEYLPISGECGVIESRYFSAGPWQSLTFPPTNDEWTVDYTGTVVTGGFRWSVTFTALVDLPYDSFLVLGGSFSGDGGIGPGPSPTSYTAGSYAYSPEISNVSGVSLDSVVSNTEHALVTVAGVNTFDAGATFTLSFTVPTEFDTNIAVTLPGLSIDIEGATYQSILAADGEVFASLAWTGLCEITDQFRITWWEPGSKTYELGVDRGVLYFDTGVIVPWNGLTEVQQNPNRNADSSYFDGVKLADFVTIEGFSAKVSAISYPKEFEEAYGNLVIRRGIYLGGQEPKTFSFCYRTKLGTDLDPDAGYKIHIVYNVLAIPDGRTYDTISDDPDVTKFGWDFRTVPETISGYRESSYVVINSTKITPSLLVELENMLYGTPDTQPRLPSLNELATFVSDYASFITIVDNGDGTWGATTLADGYINDLGGGLFEIREANTEDVNSTSYLIRSTPDPPA